MGSTTRHKKEFIQSNPICAFCGGKSPATTIEHCPPKAMFEFRQWPEGLEFPSCESCNCGTSNQDIIVSMMGRTDPFEKNGNKDGSLEGIIKMAGKQYPDMFTKMIPSVREARRHNRALGITVPPGKTHQDTCLVKIPDEIHDAVRTLAYKLSKGLFYKESRAIFPDDGCLLCHWFTNVEIVRSGKYAVFELLKDLQGHAPPLVRTGKYLNDQFSYKLSLAPEKNVFVLQATFGTSFAFVVFGVAIPGRLEEMINRLRADTSRHGPFSVLQSPTIS